MLKKEQVPNRMLCQAGSSSFTVNWQGYMRPCVMLTEPSFPVFSMDFAEAWQRLGEETARIRMNAGAVRAGCGRCVRPALNTRSSVRQL